jgi:cytosine deaminase
MLREMHLLISATRFTQESDFNAVFQMASVNGARLMGLDYGLEVGKQADLIVCNGVSTRDALNGMPFVKYVLKNGSLLAETEASVEIYEP